MEMGLAVLMAYSRFRNLISGLVRLYLRAIESTIPCVREKDAVRESTASVDLATERRRDSLLTGRNRVECRERSATCVHCGSADDGDRLGADRGEHECAA